MTAESNENAEDLRRSITQENDINVFDVFAILYLYCEPRFNNIRQKLANIDIFRGVSLQVRTLQDSILPPVRNALAPINMRSRRLLASLLRPNENQDDFDLQCFTVLRAIDNNYDMNAKSTNLLNFPTMRQHLNLNSGIALVHAKTPSPIYRMVQRLITRNSRTKKGVKCSRLRTGKDVGDYLRDYVYNLVCYTLPAGYDIDFGGLDSSIRLCFPDLENCRIALFPFIDEISQVEMKLLNLDSQNKRPFLFTSLVDIDSAIERVLISLKQMSESGINVVIFPELCVPEKVRSAISNGLRQNQFPSIKMVIAGSCHERAGEEWHNTAYVLGPDGQLLWQQRKFQPYTLMRYEAERLKSLEDFAGYDSYENISTAPRVMVVRDTPLGRMVILICGDLLHTDPHRKLLFDLGVNFIAVPTMSMALKPDFTIAAEQFAIHSQSTTLVSNVCALTREVARYKNNADTEKQISFAFLPGYPSIHWCRCGIPSGSCLNQCSRDFLIRLADWPKDFEKEY